MNDFLYSYLRYGCAIPFPISSWKRVTPKFDHKKTNESFEQIKLTYQDLVFKNTSQIEHPENGIFQLSGGFDSSLVVSYFNGINTMCMYHSDSEDVKYSKKVADYFNTNHVILDEKILLDSADFKQTIIDINRIHSYPRSFKNDSGLYMFVKWAKENADFIVGGEGLEFQMLGYENIYSKLLNLAVALNQYNTTSAQCYLDSKKCNSPKSSEIDIREVLRYRKKRPFLQNLITWWSTNFTEDEIHELGVDSIQFPEFDSIDDIIYFLFHWYGRQYVIDRREDLCKAFDIKWYTPYLMDNFVDYTFSVPIELKNCMGYHKFILYEALHDRLPKEIIERPKIGLMTDFNYYKENYENILELVAEFLDSKSLKIYDYLDYNACQKHINDFDFVKVWALLNLSIWMETHGRT